MSVYVTYGTSSSVNYLLGSKEQAECKYEKMKAGLGGFSNRISYITTAIFSLTDLVTSIVNLLFSGFDAAIYLAKSSHHNFLCKRCWTHIELASTGMIIGLAGTVFPSLGVGLSRSLFRTIVDEFPLQTRWDRMKKYFIGKKMTYQEQLVQYQISRIYLNSKD